VLGTAAYLSPEQARGEEAGPRADLYSLGVVAYQLLSGRLPYEATSLSELALKQQRESPVPLESLNPRVRPELARAISMALAIDQEARPVNAIVLADALRNGAAGVEPIDASAPTAHLGTAAATRVLSDPAPPPPTAATRMATRAPSTAQHTPAPRQALRPIPSSQQRPPRQADRGRAVRAERERRSGRAFRRFLAVMVLVAVFVIAVVVAVAVATSTSSNVVHFRNLVAHDVGSAVSGVKSLINQYT